jgi:hypothetical protein
MNEHDPLEETIACFREITPPANVRSANRMTVQVALEKRVVVHWWRRTVTIPLPAALATGAALLLSLSVHIFHAQEIQKSANPSVAVPPSVRGDNSATAFLSESATKFDYSETQSYVSGVGVVGRNIVYQFKE